MTPKRRRGATAIEFALLLPVFVVLLGGIIDGGWLFWQQSALDVAVHDGCRVASMRDPGIGNADMADVHAVAAEEVEAHMNLRGVACDGCDIVVDSLTTTTEDAVRCTVDWAWTPLFGLVPPAQIRSSITMRLEMQR